MSCGSFSQNEIKCKLSYFYIEVLYIVLFNYCRYGEKYILVSNLFVHFQGPITMESQDCLYPRLFVHCTFRNQLWIICSLYKRRQFVKRSVMNKPNPKLYEQSRVGYEQSFYETATAWIVLLSLTWPLYTASDQSTALHLHMNRSDSYLAYFGET